MDYTRLEILTDCICRKCSMRATLHRLEQDAERLTAAQAGKSSVSQSKKKRAREVKRLALRLKTALEEGRIEDEIKGVKVEKVFSRASTKQAMIARVGYFLLLRSTSINRSYTQPPPVLALHLNRSVHFGTYASKNTARVQFSEMLDLTQFTTSGMLSTSPSIPISSPVAMPFPTATASSSPLPALINKIHMSASPTPHVLYRLAAVVCHYGQHSFGHYVCFRRKPRGKGLVVPPDGPATAPGTGWLRASDESVREVGIETVLHEGAGVFMLYYERVKSEDTPAVRSSQSASWDVKTVDDVGEEEDADADADTAAKAEKKGPTLFCLQDAVKCEAAEEEMEDVAVPVIRARVVRSVSLGRRDDEEVGVGVGGASGKQEEVGSEPPGPATKSDPEEVTTPAVEGKGQPSGIPDASSSVDEPRLSLPRTVDLRA
jgi:Ubiquitin carboxyl-terminal hydrolase